MPFVDDQYLTCKKQCVVCETVFAKSKTVSMVTWEKKTKCCSIACAIKLKTGRSNFGTRGENNSMWKGDHVGYAAIHCWVHRHKPKPSLCEKCGEAPAYDAANISGEYKRDLTDWEWLCRKCHMISDGRLQKLKKYKHGNQWFSKKSSPQSYVR